MRLFVAAMGKIENCNLLGLTPVRFVRRGAKFFLKLLAQPAAHFGGGGLGEGDHKFLE